MRPKPVPLPDIDPRRLPEDHAAFAPFPAAGMFRRARLVTHASQREMAWRARLSLGAVSRVECDNATASIATLRRVLAVAGLRLAVLDAAGRVVVPRD